MPEVLNLRNWIALTAGFVLVGLFDPGLIIIAALAVCWVFVPKR